MGVLSNRTIVVTRARSQAGQLANLLEALGADIIEFPTIEIRAPKDTPHIPSLADFDWVVFTSVNAVHMFARAVEQAGSSIDTLKRSRICSVGPATADAIRELGLTVDLVPTEYIAESVLDALEESVDRLQDQRFLLPRGNMARPILPTALRGMGAKVEEVVVYETAMPSISDEDAQSLVGRKPDVITFTSGSTVQNFCELIAREHLHQLQEHSVFASIGPITTEAAQALDIAISIEPERHDIPGLVDAIVEWAQRIAKD